MNNKKNKKMREIVSSTFFPSWERDNKSNMFTTEGPNARKNITGGQQCQFQFWNIFFGFGLCFLKKGHRKKIKK